MRELARLIDEVSEDENSQHGPMLSAVVVNKERGMSGKGFSPGPESSDDTCQIVIASG